MITDDYLKRARSFYNKVDADTKVVLLKIFGEDILPTMDTIKTFDDAMIALGLEHPLIQARNILLSHEAEGLKHSIAEMELRIICAALNGGNLLSQNEDGYYPVFDLCYKVDDDKPYCMTEDGFFFAYAGAQHTCNHVVNHIRFKTKELAEYAAKQFMDYWRTYYMDI